MSVVSVGASTCQLGMYTFGLYHRFTGLLVPPPRGLPGSACSLHFLYPDDSEILEPPIGAGGLEILSPLLGCGILWIGRPDFSLGVKVTPRAECGVWDWSMESLSSTLRPRSSECSEYSEDSSVCG